MLKRFKSLEGRIATLFLVLIVVVQVMGLIVIQQGIDSNARASIATELANGEKVFRKLLEQSAQAQRFSAQVLARDTAFVQAIGNGGVDDRATIESALQSFGSRAKADLTMLIDGERKVAVSTGMDSAGSLEQLVLGLLERAEQSGAASAIAIAGQKPVQIVVVPVKAPITIAWVVMGFAIDRQLAVGMKELSSLDVAIMTRATDGRWLAVESTLPALAMPKVARDLALQPDTYSRPFDLEIAGSNYSVRLLPIGRAAERGAAERGAAVLLARS
ncbi:MAG: GGDEF domain-containing protein, partial [Bdellovibrionales bacterium]|nr:GGDEF domain-containing protein [Massilia sp.]